MIGRHVGALVAAAIFAIQPCAAAEDFTGFNSSERRSAAFGGLNVRIPLSHSTKVKPRARLQLSTVHHLRDSRSGEVRTFRPAGLELGASKAGAPALYLNGQNSADAQKRLGIGGAGTTLLVVGGVLLVLVVVALASSPPQIFDDGAF